MLNNTHDGACVEGVALTAIAAQFGTPCYVYSRAALTDAHASYQTALAGRNARICYAVKANSNLAILNVFARLGAGFDIVSGGELARVIAAGGDPAKVVFSGVGKSRAEMRQALLAGIHCFNVESASELELLNTVAGETGRRAPIALRVNPNVDPKTHPYISTGLKTSKFGVAFASARDLYRRARTLPHLDIRGIACHIGSQLLDPQPAADAAGRVLELVDSLAAEGIDLQHIDLGGGMGIRYHAETVLPTADYLAPLLARLAGRKEMLLFEPGRSLVGNAGLLLTRVEVLKPGEEKNFAVVDAAMNDLARPALYDAFHEIVKVGAGGTASAGAAANTGTASAGIAANMGTASETRTYEIVGPICESGDFLGHDRELALAEGDLLAILSAGAYGMAMSSNYNTRPRAAEVMVDGDQAHLIRRREEVAQLFALESVLP
ncbi:MAG: diaminopimelate decarboxylase [Rhodocyclaceae bacterium]|nr:diaminopimelate decarboxylase [Rhodocyclaceae bacterium]